MSLEQAPQSVNSETSPRGHISWLLVRMSVLEVGPGRVDLPRLDDRPSERVHIECQPNTPLKTSLERYPEAHDGLERLAMVAAARGDRARQTA